MEQKVYSNQEKRALIIELNLLVERARENNDLYFRLKAKKRVYEIARILGVEV